MNVQIFPYQIYWKKTKQNKARIFRIFGASPAVTVPEEIAGYPVTELADYCFSTDCRLPDACSVTAIKPDLSQSSFYDHTNKEKSASKFHTLTELSGNFIESVQLPDTLLKIGSYTFYNCRNLLRIEFGPSLETIGSDAFMNCHQLHQISIRNSIQEKTCLHKILSQITWDIEVSFLGKHPDSPYQEAVIFYPEYYEVYDEIAPAHIFGRTIAGEGFRARQSFTDGIIDFHQYDKILKKACTEESALTVCRIAYARLRYPVELSAENKKQYESCLQNHGEIFCQNLIYNRQLDALSFLFHHKLLSLTAVQNAAVLAAQTGWSEGSASILRWKQTYYQQKKRTRYEFEDF